LQGGGAYLSLLRLRIIYTTAFMPVLSTLYLGLAFTPYQGFSYIDEDRFLSPSNSFMP